jgi:hypothetical protein
MLYVLPDGRPVIWRYQTSPVLGFMVKRVSDGLYWDETAFRFKGRDYWVPGRGTLHDFEYAKFLTRMASDSPCELEIVVHAYASFAGAKRKK